MRNHLFNAAVYTSIVAHSAKNAARNTKQKVIENKSQMAVLAGTATVVGIASRAHGFRAGYEFATQNA